MKKSIYRAIDANFNRSREGLRVCEEVARFLLNDKNFTRRLKQLRHEVEGVLKNAPDLKKLLLQTRDSGHDVGKINSLSEFKRRDAGEVFEANLERSKEAVRVLEEFFKIVDKKRAAKFKDIRFKIYTMEKNSVEKLEALRNIG